jgi:hypothetical protein
MFTFFFGFHCFLKLTIGGFFLSLNVLFILDRFFVFAVLQNRGCYPKSIFSYPGSKLFTAQFLNRYGSYKDLIEFKKFYPTVHLKI